MIVCSADDARVSLVKGTLGWEFGSWRDKKKGMKNNNLEVDKVHGGTEKGKGVRAGRIIMRDKWSKQRNREEYINISRIKEKTHHEASS